MGSRLRVKREKRPATGNIEMDEEPSNSRHRAGKEDARAMKGSVVLNDRARSRKVPRSHHSIVFAGRKADPDPCSATQSR